MQSQRTRVNASFDPKDLLCRLKRSNFSDFTIQSMSTRISRLIMEYEKSISDINKNTYNTDNILFKLSNYNHPHIEKLMESLINSNLNKLKEDLAVVSHMKVHCSDLECMLSSKKQLEKQLRLDIQDLKKENEKTKVKSQQLEARAIQIKLEENIILQKIEKLNEISLQLEPTVNRRKEIYNGCDRNFAEVKNSIQSLSLQSQSIQRAITAKLFVLKDFERKTIVYFDGKEKLVQDIEELEQLINIENGKEKNLEMIIQKIKEDLNQNNNMKNCEYFDEKSDLIEKRSKMNENLFSLSRELDSLQQQINEVNEALKEVQNQRNLIRPYENAELFSELDEEERKIRKEIETLKRKERIKNHRKFTSVNW